jgi:hypothetical protein
MDSFPHRLLCLGAQQQTPRAREQLFSTTLGLKDKKKYL